MKKFTPTLLGLMVGAAAFAQSQEHTLPAQLEEFSAETMVTKSNGHIAVGAEATIWSEDFSGGIPATWTNAGFDGTLNPLASALWEYRGPSTTPSNAQGSIGAYSGVSTGSNAPIASPSTANGFVIFDSDYLDNGGVAGAFGQGSAPAPHVGTLTTDVIDLSNNPYVLLELSTYHRVFYSNFQVALSTDGGATWGDTVMVDDYNTLGVNNSSPNGQVFQANVSNEIGGQSNVKLRFLYDGRPGNANGNGYYFWMIDDIRLADLPKNSLKFTDYNGAPAHDILYGGAGEGKFGIMTLKQTRPISFDSNVLNFGWGQQNNVTLTVNIYNSSSNLVQSLSSSSTNLTAGAVADYNIMNTAAWTPTAEDTYTVVYTATSDSVTGADAPADSLTIYVTDSLMSLDFNVFTSRFGTGNIGDDGSAVGVRYDLTQDERLFGANIMLSNTTVPGGVMEVTVYDSTGFDYSTGFVTQPLAYYQHTVTQQDVDNGGIYADLTGTDGYPIYLSTTNTGAYYIVITMFSNAGANHIYLRDDASFDNAPVSTVMYYTVSSPSWYSGFTSGAPYAPHVRAVMCAAATAAQCMTISVDEVSLDNNIRVYPNPASEYVMLGLGDDINGELNIELVDLQGRVVMKSTKNAVAGTNLPIELSELTPGVYFMNVSQGEAVSTFKLTVK